MRLSKTVHNPTVRLGYRFVQWLARTLFGTLFGLRIDGRENVPRRGPFILASNHQSWFDPPIVGSTCPREIHYAAKKELFTTPIVGSLVTYLNSIPVRRSGFDREALIRLGEVLASGGAVIFFPEGTRFLDGKLHPPKAGVGMMALKYNVPIVPVYVSGSARIRRQILKRRLKVTFGRPFTLAELGELHRGKEAYYAVAEAVMKRIAEVGGVEPPMAKVGGLSADEG